VKTAISEAILGLLDSPLMLWKPYCERISAKNQVCWNLFTRCRFFITGKKGFEASRNCQTCGGESSGFSVKH